MGDCHHLVRVDAIRLQIAAIGGHDGVLGEAPLAATMAEAVAPHGVAHREPVDAGSSSDNLANEVSADDERERRGRGEGTRAHEGVHRVGSDSADTDEHIGRTGHRDGKRPHPQLVGTSMALDENATHEHVSQPHALDFGHVARWRPGHGPIRA
jgi:hypothetical protein